VSQIGGLKTFSSKRHFSLTEVVSDCPKNGQNPNLHLQLHVAHFALRFPFLLFGGFSKATLMAVYPDNPNFYCLLIIWLLVVLISEI